jgi:hypothetical protein
MNQDITITLTPAEQNIVRQSLRAEAERMGKGGYIQLSRLALDTSSKIANAILDNKILLG